MALPHTELKDVLLAQMCPKTNVCIMFLRTFQRNVLSPSGRGQIGSGSFSSHLNLFVPLKCWNKVNSLYGVTQTTISVSHYENLITYRAVGTSTA